MGQRPRVQHKNDKQCERRAETRSWPGFARQTRPAMRALLRAYWLSLPIRHCAIHEDARDDRPDQEPEQGGKLAGGISAAIPSTIATQPNHFGSAARAGSQAAAHREHERAGEDRQEQFLADEVQRLGGFWAQVVEAMGDPVFDPGGRDRADRHHDGAGQNERTEPSAAGVWRR